MAEHLSSSYGNKTYWVCIVGTRCLHFGTTAPYKPNYCQLFSSICHDHDLDFIWDMYFISDMYVFRFLFLFSILFEAKFYEPTMFESRSRTQLEDMCLFLVRHTAPRLRYRLNRTFAVAGACLKFEPEKWDFYFLSCLFQAPPMQTPIRALV